MSLDTALVSEYRKSFALWVKAEQQEVNALISLDHKTPPKVLMFLTKIGVRKSDEQPRLLMERIVQHLMVDTLLSDVLLNLTSYIQA